MVAGNSQARALPRRASKRRRLRNARSKAAAVTFHRDVLPILQKNCQTCHRPGEIAPMSLISYKDAVEKAAKAKGGWPAVDEVFALQ